tara:strand:- start:10076 stop:10360 length:285 start_codon:yes stop_codon:yes gene_type:complete
MWITLFAISACINLFALFYVRWLLSSLAAINEDVANVTDIIKDFQQHIQSVYELEMFYGDETLKSLIEHGNLLVETLDNVDLMLEEEVQIEEEI